jgi:hypothetical protein
MSESDFELKVEHNSDRNPIRPYIWVGVVAVLLIVAVIWLFSHLNPDNRPNTLENVARAGSADFDAYKDKLEFEYIDKMVYPSVVGLWQLQVRARMYNRGDRPVTGVEVVGKMLDLSDKIIAQATTVPIPRIRREPLKPGESIEFTVKVDAPGKVTEAEVKDIVVEVRGLRF